MDHQMNKADRIGADRMALAIFRLVDRGVINPRSEAADAALDYAQVGCHGGPKSVQEWIESVEQSRQPKNSGEKV